MSPPTSPTEGRRQGDRLHEKAAGRLVRNQPRQRRPRRADAADVNRWSRARGIASSPRCFSSLRRKAREEKPCRTFFVDAALLALADVCYRADRWHGLSSRRRSAFVAPSRLSMAPAGDQIARGHRHEGARDRQCGGVRRRQDRAVGDQGGLLHRRHRDAGADGTQKAVAVHIFPENQRGAAEGFRPWDLRPNAP